MIKIDNFINGELCSTENYLDCFEPAKGQVYAQVANSTPSDVERAVAAAKQAFSGWSQLPNEERARYLFKLAQLIEDNFDALVEAEVRDTGKPISMAKALDIPRSKTNFEYFASLATQTQTETYQTDTRALNYTLRSPLGPVVIISPWNLPLYLLTWKIAPALAFGNTVVAKPSEVTPMTAFILSQLCQKAGFPKGVLNILHGEGKNVGESLVNHPDIKAISFTGSTATGKRITQMASPQFKKVSLEMGGKNSAVVFEDCNIDEAVETLIKGSFNNQGQICLCTSRILVQKSIYPRFLEKFVEKAKSLKVGDPFDSSTQQGAVVSKQQFDKILSYLELAKQDGAKFETGGKPRTMRGEQAQGWFIEPTVVTGLSNSCRFNQEEIFGPVTAVIPFESEADALAMANDSRYGLTASIWTTNVSRAHRMAKKIEAGVVWINTWMLRDLRIPFGGQKESGMGREGGQEAYRFFTEIKNVCLKMEESL